MEGNDNVLAIVMCEEGEDYQINFEGSILHNGALYGKITDFDLSFIALKAENCWLKT